MRGYATAQETIKFLDTKVGIITGVSTALSGFLIAWGKWSVEAKADSAANLITAANQNEVYAICLAALFIGNLIATYLCITAAIRTVIARSKPGTEVLVLFPSHPKAQTAIARETLARKLKGMSQTEVLHEYQKQLQAVGQILGEKLRAHRWACVALLGQVSTVILTIIVVAGIYFLKDSSAKSQSMVPVLSTNVTSATNSNNSVQAP
jgi:hypothetical protein